MKEYDIFMDMAFNQDATLDNLVVAGLNANNTMLQDKSVYAKDEQVKQIFSDDQGNFDQKAFDTFYNNAKASYNNLSNTDYDESVKKQATYHRDNMFVPQEQRRKGPEFREVIVSNPYKISNSTFRIGVEGERQFSIDELAQQNRVLLNPTTAGENLENAQWGDAPNNNFWGYFTDTLVLAQYDDNGTHINPVTGEEETHQIGDLKLDQNGDFYYEKLDGRDIYGKRVLNKMNVLTTDGSWANKYDFFDSDGIEQKSIGSSVLKNLALVGTMFIPYVGPLITAASIGFQLTGVLGTLGKMFVGSDSPTLSAMEGWSKSMSRQGAVSEYAAEHTWCWENFINLIGDTMAQLKEQRFIFEKVPTLFKGKLPTTSKAEQEAIKKYTANRLALGEKKIAEMKITDASQLLRESQNLRKAAGIAAVQDLQAFSKSFNNLGAVLGKGYMTAITVQDMYGEAKMQGASDIEATMLTLGFAAGEYAILSTGLGEWIMPEKRLAGLRTEAIAKALTQPAKEGGKSVLQEARAAASKISKEGGKKQYIKELFNLGKKTAKDIYTAEKVTVAKSGTATLAAATGEGVEEVSEELLSDFAKGCFNVTQWLAGDTTRMNTFGYDFKTHTWDAGEVLDRYGMSLVGGFIGGGLTNAVTNYRQLDSFTNINHSQALNELIYMVRNGQDEEFMKQVNKMELAPKNLSTDFEVINGYPMFSQGTPENNQDKAVKTVLQKQIDIIKEVLSVDGAVSDSEFLDRQVLQDMRYNALQNSTTAGLYLQTYNELLADTVKLTNNIKEAKKATADTNGDGTTTDKEVRQAADVSESKEQQIKRWEKELKEKRQQITDLLEGKYALDFVSTALIETTPALSSLLKIPANLETFAKNKYKKEYEDLTEEELKQATEEYEVLKTTEFRTQISEAAKIYRDVLQLASPMLQQQAATYNSQSEDLRKLDLVLSRLFTTPTDPTTGKGIILKQALNEGAEKFLEMSQMVSNSQSELLGRWLISTFGSEQDTQKIEDIMDRPYAEGLSEEEKLAEIDRRGIEVQEAISNIVLNNIEKFIQPFIDRGFANFETKNQLKKIMEQMKALQIRTANDRLANFEGDDEGLTEIFTETEEVRQKINDLSTAVDNLSNTPLEINLNELAKTLGKKPISFVDTIEKANQVFNNVSNDISLFNINDDLQKDIVDLLYMMDLYEAIILGSRTDSANLNDYWGYNATLNQISRNIKGVTATNYAEIDHQTADIFIADLQAARNKLNYLLDLNAINNNQKLTKQDRVSDRKNILMYNRLKYIVSIDDDDFISDWEGFQELKAVIEGMNIHSHYSTINTGEYTKIPADKRKEFEQEKISAENAIYDFFQKNIDKVSDPKQLAKLLNPSKLGLYTEAKDLLTEDLETIDDNSFVWWLASRAALRSSDFYSMYAKVIDPDSENPMAPIATQELAIYNNLASILNGNMFTHFYEAYRLAVKEDWTKKTPAERATVLTKLGKDSATIDLFKEDDKAEYVFEIIEGLKYSNIVLTEGAPGTGKTSNVFGSTIAMLKAFYPDVLKKVAVVHGTGIDSANKLKQDIGLESSNAYDRSRFMKEVSTEWKDIDIDDKGFFTDPNTDIVDGEFKSTLTINSSSEAPSLIMIDEISKFSNYDLDLINKYAQQHGITVLVAGDFDQSGIKGKQEIPGVPADYNAELSRTNFIRCPKLGVSMRTDNLHKSINLQRFRYHMHNPNEKESLKLEYAEEDGELYGDYVIKYNVIIDDRDRVKKADKQDCQQEVLEKVQQLIESIKKEQEKGKPLSDDQKIGYIYNDPTSPIYTVLQQDGYREYINFKKGGAAQGLEARYYIVEMDVNPDGIKEFDKDLYTGMSRSKQGSILIIPYSDVPTTLVRSVNHIKKELTKEYISPQIIRNYANKRKQLLTEIVTDGKTPEITKRLPKAKTLQPPAPTNLGPTIQADLPTRISLDLQNKPFSINDNIEVKDKGNYKIIDAYTIGQKSFIQLANDSSETITVELSEFESKWGTEFKEAIKPGIPPQKDPPEDDNWDNRHNTMVNKYGNTERNGIKVISEVSQLDPQVTARTNGEWFLPGDIITFDDGASITVEMVWPDGSIEQEDGTKVTTTTIEKFFTGESIDSGYIIKNSRLGDCSPQQSIIDNLAKELTANSDLTTDKHGKVLRDIGARTEGSLVLDNLPEITRSVDAHGIAKGDEINHLLNILINGIDTNRAFFTAPLDIDPDKAAGMGAGLGTGGGTAYKDGVFIIASEPGKELTKDGIKTVLINPMSDDLDSPQTQAMIKLRDNLKQKFPNVDFILYSEAQKYYTDLTAKQNSPQAAPIQDINVYGDDYTPLSDNDIIKEGQYQKKVEGANSTTHPAKSTVGQGNSLTMLLHTFATFQTGVIKDQDGNYVTEGGQPWEDVRIDGVNGLKKIDALLGRSPNIISNYITTLGDIRSIVLNTQDKATIEKEISKILGLQEIYCTFALTKVPRKQDNKTYFYNAPNPLDRSTNETNLYHGSEDVRSAENPLTSIDIIIGTKENGNLLQIPLFTPSSPFTLAQITDANNIPIFPAALNIINRLWGQKGLHEISVEIVKALDGNPQYQSLVNLFKLFNITNGFIYTIKDPQWTPLNNLQYIGPQIVTHAGEYQLESGLEMNDSTNPEDSWITLSDFKKGKVSSKEQTEGLSKNPQFTSTPILLSKYGRISGVEKEVVQAGHPFIIVSSDLNISAPIEIVDRFALEQKDPNLPKKTKIVYVLPPTASIEEYIDKVYQLTFTKEQTKPIGYLGTTAKLMKILWKDEGFINIMKTKYPELMESGALEQAMKTIYEAKDMAELKNALYTPYNWKQFRIGVGETSLCYLLDNVLACAARKYQLGDGINKTLNDWDSDAINTIISILNKNGIDYVFYHIGLPKSDSEKVYGDFVQGVYDENNYTIDGKPVRIHGKIDSPTFRGSIDEIVSQALSSLRVQGGQANTIDQLVMSVEHAGFATNKDTQTYWDYSKKSRGNSSVNGTTVSPQQAKINRRINEVVNQVSGVLGFDVSNRFENIQDEAALNSALNSLVNDINAQDNKRVAFILDGQLHVSPEQDILSGVVNVLKGTAPSTDISDLKNNFGDYVFEITATDNSGQPKTIQATYKSIGNELELMESQQPEGSQAPQQLQSNPFNNLNEGTFSTWRKLITPILEAQDYFFDDDLKNAMEEESYEDFFNAATQIQPLEVGEDEDGDMDLLMSQMIENTIQENSSKLTDSQQQSLGELVQLYKYLENKNSQEEEQNQNETCPMVIKFKM